MPAENDKTIDNWSVNYLNTLEVIYGAIELHPFKMLEETNMDWLEAFMPTHQDNLLVDQWTESYFAAYSLLYGPLTPQVPMDIQEINQQWIDHFYQETRGIEKMHPAA